jgi:hypothetical protein
MMIMRHGAVLALAGAACLTVVAADPIVWYRADMGVTTNASGKVTAWANQGTLGSVADLANTNAAAPGVTFLASNSTMGNAPVLEFDAHDILISSSAYSLGRITEGGAWFVAFRSYESGTSGTNYGPFGHGTSGSRFGFFQNSSSKFQLYYYGTGNMVNSDWRFDTNADIVSCGTFKYKDGSSDMGIQGWRRGEAWSVFYGWNARDSGGRFVVGVFNPELPWTKPFRGLIAEARYYNAPMTAAERFCVECEMAARYAIPLASPGAFSCSAETLRGCTNAPAAFGSASQWGKAAVMETSATSGALTASFAGTPADTNLVYIAHDGGAGLVRTWCVAGMDNARAVPLVLTFTGSEYASAGDVFLFHKDDLRWEKVAAERTVQGGAVSFSLPAGWKSGRYRVCTGDDQVALSAAVWFRADRGVTVNGSGMVTAWANGGFLGSECDLVSTNYVAGLTPDVVFEEDGIGSRPSLRFADSDYLRTAGEVDLGITSDGGGAYFLVCRFDPDPDNQKNMCPFGIWSPATSAGTSLTTSQRFGVQCAKTWSGRPTRAMFYGGQSYDLDMVFTNDSQIIACGAYDVDSSRKVSASQSGNIKFVGNTIAPYAGVLSVGEFNITAFKSGYYGQVSELRIYNRPLTAREFADIELELSVRYGIDVKTAGSLDVAGFAAHQEDYKVIGIAANYGVMEVNPPVTWSDGTLSFSFKVAPSASDPNSPLAVLGHDGGGVTFAPWRNAYVESLGRTWFVSESNPARGGVLEFSFAMAANDKKRYQLYRKAAGEADYSLCSQDFVKTGTGVSFTLDRLYSGVYRLVRKPAYAGFGISIR